VASIEIHKMAFWVCDMALRPWTKSANTPSFRLSIKQSTHIFIMKTKNHTQTISTLAALAGLALAAGSAHAATTIPILNGGFENSGGGPAGGGNNAVVDDWNEEDAGSVYIDNAGTTNKPDADAVLYFNSATAAVNQDLGHNWSLSDSFTLGIEGHNPNWDPTGIFKVQLRQTDGTVLWDSGDLDVSGTVVGPSYTGTGHIFNWTFDASAFSGAGVSENEQLNIRIASVGVTTYIDDVSLEVSVVPEPTTTALLGLGGLALILRRRK
jgi:hypothetical protein